MIANPIIRKEVLMALRTRKAIAMQVLFLLVMAGLISLLWPEGGLQDIAGYQARRILATLAVAQLVMVVMFAPAFTAASLTGEKEHNTLESLLATSLPPWKIAVGKMVGSLAFIVLLVLTGAAALAMPFLLGGVTGWEVLAIVAVLLTTAVYLGMIGMLVSAVTDRSYRAIIITYAVLLVVCFLFALPAWPISRELITRGGRTWQVVLHVLASLSPLQAMLSLLWPTSAYATGAEGMPPFWQLYLPLSGLVIIAAAIACLVKLSRPIATPKAVQKLRVVERGQISARTFLFLVDPRKRKRMIAWWQNPVAMKEFRSRPMLQTHWLLRAVGVCLIVSVLLMFVISLGVTAFVAESAGMIPMMASGVAGLMIVVIIMIGPAMTSGAICSDLETGVWDLMRATRLSSWQIVSGKFQAAIVPLLLITLAMVPALAVLLVFDLNMWPNVLRVLYVAGMTILFVSVCGTFFSSIFSRTSTATAWTYAVVITLGLATLLVLLAEELFSLRFIRSVFVVNPVAAALDAAGNPSMQKLGLVAPHLKTMGLATAALFVATVVRVFQLRRAE